MSYDTVPLTHMNVQESMGNSLIPRISCRPPVFDHLQCAIKNWRQGRSGNEAKRGSLVNLCERSKEREENGVEEKGKEK